MTSSLLKSSFIFCILFTVSLLAYLTFTRQTPRSPPLLWVPSTTSAACAANLSEDRHGPTTLSHVVFSIAASASTWHERQRYSNLWWDPNSTRGSVWLDKFPPEQLETLQPLRVIRFDPDRHLTGSGRIASIVKAAYDSEQEEARWFVMGDDDTVFFKENLMTVLSRYDHRGMWYIGDISESVEQNVMHSYLTAYGGGGFAISRPLVCQLARAMDGCLHRYASYYGSDEKISACIAEHGVALTRESGFHQRSTVFAPRFEAFTMFLRSGFDSHTRRTLPILIVRDLTIAESSTRKTSFGEDFLLHLNLRSSIFIQEDLLFLFFTIF